MKWRVHLLLRPHARANACQPQAKDTFPAVATLTPTHEALLQQPSAWTCGQQLAGKGARELEPSAVRLLRPHDELREHLR